MELQILSDYPIIDDAWKILISTCRRYPEITGIHEIKNADNIDPAEPILVLGKPDRAAGLTPTTRMLLTVKQILGTSGGGTKLDHAIRLIARPLDEVTRTVLSTPPEWFGDPIAVDIETSGDISVDEPEDTELLSVSVARWSSPTEIETYALTQDALRSPLGHETLDRLVNDNETIWHNGKFDCRWLASYLGRPVYPDDDTMLMHACLYPAAGENGLKDLAKRMFNAPDWEADVRSHTKSKAHYERIPQDILCDYNQWDVYWTLRLAFRLWQELLDNPDALQLYNDVMPASRMLQDVEGYGIPVDTEYAARLDTELDTTISAVKTRLQDQVGDEHFNPASPQQVGKVLAKQGFNMGSTDEATLTGLRMRNIPEHVDNFCADLLEFRALSKIQGTYIKSVAKKVRNGRVHPTFLVHGTSTGRLSSRGPNAQNIPNDTLDKPSVKTMFRAEQGRLFVGCDYKQAELRTMAELSGDALMIADLQVDAPDFFDNMLPTVFPEVDFTVLSKEQRKPYRLRLKRTVYGTSYGLQANTVANMLTLEGTPTTVAEAEAIQNGYLGRYPGLQKWRQSILPRVIQGDDLITPFGRRFQQDTLTVGYMRRIQNQALAFSPQSIASDICVRAAIALHPLLLTIDSHIIVLVHDQIVADAPEENAQEVADLVAENMREAAAEIFTRVPFLVDAKIGKTLADL